MKRFFVKNTPPTTVLVGDAHKHLSLVLRAKPGDRVTLCPGDGSDYVYEISDLSKTETRLKFIEKSANDKEPRVRLTVFSALMKGDRNELAAQKLTELGVAEIAPFYSEHCVTKPSDKHRQRLGKICEEASRQCGRAVVPVVSEDLSFSDMLTRLKKESWDLIVFPYENADERCLADYLKTRDLGSVARAAVIVGAEGGFSEKEAGELSAIGIQPVTLGKRILRAETANIAVAAIVMYALGELR